MKKYEKYLVWMNCYGSWAPELRRSIETKGYDQYLDVFVKKIRPWKEQIRAIYISGGMLDAKSRTECETTRPELENRLKRIKINIPIQTDEESVTSISIVRKFLETWQREFPDCTPVLFCDEVRAETNRFVLKYFAQKMDIEGLVAEEIIVPLPRLDDHPHSTKEFQTAKLRLLQEIGVEAVEQAEIKERR